MRVSEPSLALRPCASLAGTPLPQISKATLRLRTLRIYCKKITIFPVLELLQTHHSSRFLKWTKLGTDGQVGRRPSPQPIAKPRLCLETVSQAQRNSLTGTAESREARGKGSPWTLQLPAPSVSLNLVRVSAQGRGVSLVGARGPVESGWALLLVWFQGSQVA